MSEGYVKLFNSILLSSVWQEDDATRLLWITMLATADRGGHVTGSTPGLAHTARIPLAACERALALLASPDPSSQNPQNEGRRIAAAERGWLILNYADYRRRLSKEDRKEYKRLKQAEYRANSPQLSTLSTNGQSGHKQKQIAEADISSASADSPARESKNWIDDLSKSPAYQGIDVNREYAKMLEWCKIKKSVPTKRRFVNWLNRIDAPLMPVISEIGNGEW